MLTIIASSYDHAKSKKLQAFVYSVAAQSNNNWRLFVIHDGPPDKELQEFVNQIPDLYPKITFLHSDKRENRWGHNLRNQGLDLVESKYLNWTNSDNQVLPEFVNYMLTTAEDGDYDLVYCDFIHNQHIPGSNNGTYTVIESLPFVGRIDFCNFIVKTELAKKIRINEDNLCADGDFIDRLFKENPNLKVKKIPKCLVIHN